MLFFWCYRIVGGRFLFVEVIVWLSVVPACLECSQAGVVSCKPSVNFRLLNFQLSDFRPFGRLRVCFRLLTLSKLLYN